MLIKKKMFKNALFALLVFCPVVLQANITQENIDRLSLGMSFQEVKSVLGEPQTRLKRGDSSRWNYVFNDKGDTFSVWFGLQGLQNAYGGDFLTIHLVKPPEGFQQPESYDPNRDINRQVGALLPKVDVGSAEDNIFKPLLPKQEALAALDQWKTAWETKNVLLLTSKYIKNYSPKSRVTHEQWVGQLVDKVSSADSINVSIEQPQVDLLDDFNVRVTFNQVFASNRYRKKTKKRVDMQYVGGEWLIKKERHL